MVITLTGENSFSLGRELQKLLHEFIAVHGDLALERIDSEEATFARIQEALSSLPFLATKKMVVLRRPSANKEFVELAQTQLTDIPETTELILIEPKLDKRLAYYKFLKKKTDFREYNELDSSQLAQWLVLEAKERKGLLMPADAHYLIDRVGANQQLLASELEKLLLYKPEVTHENIDLLTEATPQSTIFQLLEAAFRGDAKQTLKLYGEQRSLKVEPPQIVAMLAWQLHVLALLKTAGGRTSNTIAADAKISPFVVQKSQAIAEDMSMSELKKLLQGLLSIDARSKSENLDADEALQNYLLSITY
jgi:DNA polymerase-3 subunit delta